MVRHAAKNGGFYMTRRSYYILIIFIILMLLFSIVFANIAPNNNINDGTVNNFHNTMILALSIDYGRAVTQSNYVTLNLNVTGRDVNLNSLKVQFSLDNKNWSGYNSSTQKWESGFFSEYQLFYPSFYIGSNRGLKTVYTRVIDNNGNVGSADAKINFSPHTQDPYIENPQSLELNNFRSSLTKAGIKSGSGSLYDPYIISKNNTRLISRMPNVTEVRYYMDKGDWSPRYKVTNGQADIPIVFNNVEGLKEVRLRSKNKYEIEGNAEIVYYLLDCSKPVISLHTDYHSFIAVGGKLEFDLEAYDNLSDSMDFIVEVYSGGNKIVREGKIEKYDDAKSTITPIIIEGLPKGRFNVKVTVTDEAGNKSTKQISVNSIL